MMNQRTSGIFNSQINQHSSQSPIQFGEFSNE